MAQASSPHAAAEESGASDSTRRRWNPKLALPLVIGVLLLAGAVGLRYWLTPTDDSVISLSGRIEADETNLGAKVGGRILEVAVREGDHVTVGQLVARLDDAELQAQLVAAQAQVAAAQQQVNQAELQVTVVGSQIQEAQITRQQAEGDTAGRVSQAMAQLAAAQAQLAETQARVQETQATLALAQADRNRFSNLVAQGAIPKQQFDQIQTLVATTQETLKARQSAAAAAQQQVIAAQGALTQTQTTQLNPDLRTAQIQRLQTQQNQARAQLAGAEANLRQAQAAQTEVEARRDDLTITSPIAGVVSTRLVEPGEVIAPGARVLTLVNLDAVYLRGFIPQGEVGRVRVGQTANVFLDSAPDQPLAARVTAVDTEASFTPENIYFRDDRVTQVFGLRLTIDQPGGFAKPGMPADGEILLDGTER